MRLRKLTFILASPLLAVGLLAGMTAEHRTYRATVDYEPFHAKAKAAVESLPISVDGPWVYRDTAPEIPREATKLLKPNVILSRRYTSLPSDVGPPPIDTVSELIVQCRNAGDMLGHYPPVCYPSHGHEKVSAETRVWRSGNTTLRGTEYHFRNRFSGQERSTVVYNFLVVPRRGVCPDMDAVAASAEDYQARYYGAAQFQVVFQSAANAEPTREERDRVFVMLMDKAVPAIRVLSGD